MRRLGLGTLVVLGGLASFRGAANAQFLGRGAVRESGERALFSIDDDGTTTAVLQLDFVGDVDDFVWVLPVPAMPSRVAFAPRALLDALDGATSPVFHEHSMVEGTCAHPGLCMYPSSLAAVTRGGCAAGCGCGSRVDFATMPFSPPLCVDWTWPPYAAVPDGAVDMPLGVIAADETSPYEIEVLEGADATAVGDWLVAHGFAVPSTLADELFPYVAVHDAFVLVRLRRSRLPSSGEIPASGDLGRVAPLLVTYAGSEPFVPLGVTSDGVYVATPLTVFVLAEDDAAPKNYAEVRPTSARLIRVAQGATREYALAVEEAVRAFGGAAVVREYTGPTPRVEIEIASIDGLRAETDYARFVHGLGLAGMVLSPQLLAILVSVLPPPPSTEAVTFYGCLMVGCGGFTAYVGAAPFDPSALVDTIEVTLNDPRRLAQDLLDRHTRLSRFFGVLTRPGLPDPVFVRSGPHPFPSDQTVDLVLRCDSAYLPCEAPSEARFSDGTVTPYEPGTPYLGDRAYCARFGDVPYVAPVATSSSCAVGDANAGTLAAFASLVMLLAVHARRRSRARRRPPPRS